MHVEVGGMTGTILPGKIISDQNKPNYWRCDFNISYNDGLILLLHNLYQHVHSEITQMLEKIEMLISNNFKKLKALEKLYKD